MKLTLKLFLILSLFSSIALAEGDQPNGGLTGEQSGVKAASESCGDQGNGSRGINDQSESILTFIQEYLVSIFE